MLEYCNFLMTNVVKSVFSRVQARKSCENKDARQLFFAIFKETRGFPDFFSCFVHVLSTLQSSKLPAKRVPAQLYEKLLEKLLIFAVESEKTQKNLEFLQGELYFFEFC